MSQRLDYTVYSKRAARAGVGGGDGGQVALKRTRRRHPESKDCLRREILDAARELFVKEGYRNVSLRKIARRIGYTPMSIYLHFADKADILDCICEETFTGFLAAADRLEPAASVDAGPRERLEASLRVFIEFGLAHPHHYQLTF